MDAVWRGGRACVADVRGGRPAQPLAPLSVRAYNFHCPIRNRTPLRALPLLPPYFNPRTLTCVRAVPKRSAYARKVAV